MPVRAVDFDVAGIDAGGRENRHDLGGERRREQGVGTRQHIENLALMREATGVTS